MRRKYGAPKGITHRGLTLSLRGWAKRLGVPPTTLQSRIAHGWPLGLALSPVRMRGTNSKARAMAFLYFQARFEPYLTPLIPLEPNSEAATIASHGTDSDT